MLNCEGALTLLEGETYDAVAVARTMTSLPQGGQLFPRLVEKVEHGKSTALHLYGGQVALSKAVIDRNHMDGNIILLKALRVNLYLDLADRVENVFIQMLIELPVSEAKTKFACKLHRYFDDYGKGANFLERLHQNPTLCDQVKTKLPGTTESRLVWSEYAVPCDPFYVPRPNEEDELQKDIERMIQDSLNRGVPRGSLLVKGEGGIGKSLLVAHGVCRNSAFLQRNKFSRVLWLNVHDICTTSDISDKKHLANVYRELAKLAKIAIGSHEEDGDVPKAFAAGIQHAIHNRVLIILDDLYNKEMFEQLGNFIDNVYLVGISRSQRVAELTSCSPTVHVEKASREFLKTILSPLRKLGLQDCHLDKLVKICDGLPIIARLLLSIINRFKAKAAALDAYNDVIAKAVELVQHESKEAAPRESKARLISDLFLVDFKEARPELQERFFVFLLYPEGAAVPLAELRLLWGCRDSPLQMADEFLARSWVRIDCDRENLNENTKLSIHSFLYSSILKFALECIAERDQLEIRRFVLEKAGPSVLTKAIHEKRIEFIERVMDVLLSNEGNSQRAKSALFEVAGCLGLPEQTALASFLDVPLFRHEGETWQSYESLRWLCIFLEQLLLLDSDQALQVIKHTCLLQRLLDTVVDGQEWKSNAMLVAASDGQISLLLLLIHSRPIVLETVDDFERNIVSHIVEAGNDFALRALLRNLPEKSANLVNHQDKNGDTPLHVAIRSGWVMTAQTLFGTKECDRKIKNRIGVTAEQLLGRHKEMQESLASVSTDSLHSQPDTYMSQFVQNSNIFGAAAGIVRPTASGEGEGEAAVAAAEAIMLATFATYAAVILKAYLSSDSAAEIALWVGVVAVAFANGRAIALLTKATFGALTVVTTIAALAMILTEKSVLRDVFGIVIIQAILLLIAFFARGSGLTSEMAGLFLAKVFIFGNFHLAAGVVTPLASAALAASVAVRGAVAVTVDVVGTTIRPTAKTGLVLVAGVAGLLLQIIDIVFNKKSVSVTTASLAAVVAATTVGPAVAEFLREATVVAVVLTATVLIYVMTTTVFFTIGMSSRLAAEKISSYYQSSVFEVIVIVSVSAVAAVWLLQRLAKAFSHIYQNGTMFPYYIYRNPVSRDFSAICLILLVACFVPEPIVFISFIFTASFLAAAEVTANIALVVGQWAFAVAAGPILSRAGFLEARLRTAAQNDLCLTAQNLLLRGASVDSRNDRQWTPLMFAGLRGRLVIAQMLLDRGATVDSRDVRQNTPFMFACQNGHVAVAKLLLEHGASTNARNLSRETPMTAASQNGRWKILELLLESGNCQKYIDAVDKYSMTALMYAAWKGHLQCVKCLLNNEADPNVSTHFRWNALMLACEHGSEATVQALIRTNKMDVNGGDHQGKTSLMIAAKNGNASAASVLLENGADPNARSKTDWTALMYGAKGGHCHVVEILLRHGADRSLTAENMNAKEIATNAGHPEVAKLLSTTTTTLAQTTLT